MAQLRTKRNFKSLSDQMGVWISEYQGKIRVHFRQIAEKLDETKEPKKHYLFIDADKLTSLQTACLHADLEAFKSYVVAEHHAENGDTHVTELVLFDFEQSRPAHFQPIHMLQQRNLKYETPFKYVAISNMEEFKNILEKIHLAYDEMTEIKPIKSAKKDSDDKPKPKRQKTLKAKRGKGLLKPLQLFPEPAKAVEGQMKSGEFQEKYQPSSPIWTMI